ALQDEVREEAAAQRPADADMALACRAGCRDLPSHSWLTTRGRHGVLNGIALIQCTGAAITGQVIKALAFQPGAPEDTHRLIDRRLVHGHEDPALHRHRSYCPLGGGERN